MQDAGRDGKKEEMREDVAEHPTTQLSNNDIGPVNQTRPLAGALPVAPRFCCRPKQTAYRGKVDGETLPNNFATGDILAPGVTTGEDDAPCNFAKEGNLALAPAGNFAKVEIRFLELRKLLNVSQRSLYRRIKAGELTPTGRDGTVRGPGAMTFALGALPAEVQAQYWTERAEQSAVQSLDAEQADDALALTKWQKAELTRRVEMVADTKAALAVSGPDEKVKVMKAQALKHGIGLTTLYRYINRAGEGGEKGLIPGRSRKGSARSVFSPELQAWAEAHYLLPTRPSARQVYRAMEDFCHRSGAICPSYGTVAKYLKEYIAPSEAMMAREGVKKWRAFCAPQLIRDYADADVNEVWVADTRQMDTFVNHPVTGEIVRPRLVCIGDIHSARLVAYRFVPREAPMARDIACAFRDGVMRCGSPPLFFQTDNGKDYRAELLWGGEDEAACLAALGVQPKMALPFSPNSKPIESWFNYIACGVENLFPAHSGRDAKEKPDITTRQLADGVALQWGDYVDRMTGWIEKRNRQHPVGERPCPPNWYYGEEGDIATWDRRPTGDLPPRPPRYSHDWDLATLDLLLNKVVSRTVNQNGIWLNRRLYYTPRLAWHVNRTVTVYYDEGDLRSIRVKVRDEQDRDKWIMLEVPERQKTGWDSRREDTRLAIAQRAQDEWAVRKAVLGRQVTRAAMLDEASVDPTGAIGAAYRSAGTGKVINLRDVRDNLPPEDFEKLVDLAREKDKVQESAPEDEDSDKTSSSEAQETGSAAAPRKILGQDGLKLVEMDLAMLRKQNEQREE